MLERTRGLRLPLCVLVAVVSVSGAAQTRKSASPAKINPAAEALRLNNLGVAYMGQQRLAEALRAFRRSEQLSAKLGIPRLNQAIALLNLQRFAEARRVLKAVLERDPDNARVWYNLGLLDRAQGQDEAALADFQRAAKLAPNDPDTWYFLGATFSQLHREKDAIAALNRGARVLRE